MTDQRPNRAAYPLVRRALPCFARRSRAMEMQIRFPGDLAVAAEFGGFRVQTDQPVEHGGGGGAPAPFDLFLASLGTCAGFYALRFCRQRAIPTTGLALTLHTANDPERHGLGAVRLELRLPDGFPEKYRFAILRAMDQCAVKRQLMDPPAFEITAVGEHDVASTVAAVAAHPA